MSVLLTIMTLHGGSSHGHSHRSFPVPNTIHAFDYLSATERFPPASVCAVFGDERFLKRLVLNQLRERALAGDSDLPFSSFDGEEAEWRDVLDELSTLSLFSDCRRLVMVDQADSFISRYRPQLEQYVSQSKSGSVLLLEVGAWPNNTRLYKALDKSGLQIECRAPQRASGRRKELDKDRLLQWLTSWGLKRHEITLTPTAVDLLFELIGPDLGLLDQELAKLALFAEPKQKISPELVRDVVGGWRVKSSWDLVDAAADGNAAEALRQLDRLLQTGEHPLAMLGPISWSLRRFAAAKRIVEQAELSGHRLSLSTALEKAGFRKWPREAMERSQRQLKQIGRERAGCLHRWLLETDLALKGTHSSAARSRLALERLLIRLSHHAAQIR